MDGNSGKLKFDPISQKLGKLLKIEMKMEFLGLQKCWPKNEKNWDRKLNDKEPNSNFDREK